jgi:hypothetical protein
MNTLSFRRLTGLDAYEVRRDGAALGQVEQVDHVVTTRSENSATVRKVKRWRFQMVGAMPSRLIYKTRKHCASALATTYDAHQRAKAAAP